MKVQVNIVKVGVPSISYFWQNSILILYNIELNFSKTVLLLKGHPDVIWFLFSYRISIIEQQDIV